MNRQEKQDNLVGFHRRLWDHDGKGISQAMIVRPAYVGCESACKKDPLFGVIGIQSGPRDRGSTLASMILGSRGWDAGRGDDCEDSPRVF